MRTFINILTLSRIFLAAVIFLLLISPDGYLLALILFFLAGITDYFDGYLARKLEQSTPFGAFLDPVADKLIVGTALLMITHSYADLWITLPSIALLVREIYVSALREWMGSSGVRETVKVSFVGKAKTTAQMLALIGLLSGLETFMGFPIYWVSLGYILLYIAAVLSIWSMVVYTKAAWPHLSGALSKQQ